MVSSSQPAQRPRKQQTVGQRLLEPLAVRFEADHLLRDPLDYLPGAGFGIDEVKRSKWGIVERLRARKPGQRETRRHRARILVQ